MAKKKAAKPKKKTPGPLADKILEVASNLAPQIQDKESEIELSPQQEVFCNEYMVDFNGSKAAVRAGYSKDSAASIASELLARPLINERVKELLRNRTAKIRVTEDLVLAELHRLIEVDVGELYDEAGKVRSMKEIPASLRRAVASVQTIEVHNFEGDNVGTIQKLKLYDKTKALQLAGRYLKLYTDKLEVKVDDLRAKTDDEIEKRILELLEKAKEGDD